MSFLSFRYEVIEMAKQQEINIIKHFPETEEGMLELRKRVSIVHAQVILNRINKLPIPTDQKIKLLDAIIEDQKAELKKPPKAREMER